MLFRQFDHSSPAACRAMRTAARVPQAATGVLGLLLLSFLKLAAQDGSCCGSELAVGFSTERISSSVPFEGILGVDVGGEGERCAAEAELIVEVGEGQVGTAAVYVNAVSQFPDTFGSGLSCSGLVLTISGEGSISSDTVQRLPDSAVGQGDCRWTRP